MAAEEKTAGRGTTATVVATAAVTLALGITAAALGGASAPHSAAPEVVLVPVAPDGRGEPSPTVPVPREPEVLLAEREDDHEDDHDDDD